MTPEKPGTRQDSARVVEGGAGEPSSPLVRLLREARRRRVFRTAGLYVIGAWILLQLADVVFPGFGIPDAAIKGLVWAAVAGFPIALVFGWLFDVGAHGISRERPAGAEEASAIDLGLRPTDFAILGALLVVAGAVIWSGVWLVPDPPADEPGGVANEGFLPSIALLPFEAASAGEDTSLLADGIHGDLITRLTKIKGLKIIARASVRSFAGSEEDPAVIGERLGVRNLLEGRVWVLEDQVRIAVQLLDLESMEYLWAETFDRELTAGGVFALQSDITRAISEALQLRLAPESGINAETLPTKNIDAYRDFIAATRTWTSGEQALALLKSAVEKDPNFALAWAELASAYANDYWWSMGNEEIKRRSLDAIERAEQIDPLLPEIQFVRGHQAYHLHQDYDEALRQLELARRAMPGSAIVLEMKANALRYFGRHEEAIATYREALRLDPLSETTRWELFVSYQSTRQFDRARNLQEAALTRTTEFEAFIMVLFNLERLDWLQYGDPSSMLEVMLRPDLTPRLQRRANPETITYFTWVAGDLERALQYSSQISIDQPGPVSRFGFSPRGLNRGLILREVGRDADGIAVLEQGAQLASEELEENPDDGWLLLELAYLEQALGANEVALELARRAKEAFRPPVTQTKDTQLQFAVERATLLCAAGALDEAADAFGAILSEVNWATLPRLINGWPPCRKRMAGTPQHERLQAQFAHLSSGNPGRP